MLFHIFIAIAVFFLKTEAKTLFVIDIGYQTPDVTLGQKIAVLSCQVNGSRILHCKSLISRSPHMNNQYESRIFATKFLFLFLF